MTMNAPIQMTRCCPQCLKEYVALLSQRADWPERWHRWRVEGEMIQDVWSFVPRWVREQLLSGLCSEECWDEYLRNRMDMGD